MNGKEEEPRKNNNHSKLIRGASIKIDINKWLVGREDIRARIEDPRGPTRDESSQGNPPRDP